jgi:hypothetical protein
MGLKMRLFKKRLAAFVSNWLGVLIAILIVLVTGGFGGLYLYSRTRIDNTLNFVTQVVNLRYSDGLVLSATTENPSVYIYHIVLQVYNPYTDTIDVSISDVSITLDTYVLGIGQDGPWDKTVSTGYEIFEGYVTIPADTFASLVAKGAVDVDIKGTISGSGQYKLLKRHTERPISILIPEVRFQLNP